ncbi:unnamed protein product (macronuclear) [Paramecium tetraurelia]|uniref:Transmembrane protein n=1 Tax=Paramecium tetraurelia TaxID=5888 RepID=A0BPX3_PARTE|nr:uncharacterized protein GSPATT00005341001 [Paramecium tetraurelia]CAK60590.1 unnamed protein product [Paramecium tetraurelia]|eukprot:XP_001427988.1 hypothetical protein (macronuclear) [Paramecium tetraurelia strain d4-2]
MNEKIHSTLRIKEIVEQAKISIVKLISIRNKEVTTIYELILGLNNLQILIISNNKIQIITQSIQSLINLKVVHASDCNLQDQNIENDFFELDSLKEFNMTKNQLSIIDRFTSLFNLCCWIYPIMKSQNSIEYGKLFKLKFGVQETIIGIIFLFKLKQFKSLIKVKFRILLKIHMEYQNNVILSQYSNKEYFEEQNQQ